MAKDASKNKPTFEQALADLQEIVTAIEEGQIGLEESITQYEKGMKLIQRCRSILSAAEARIQKLQVSETGEVTPVPVEPPANDAG